MDGQASERGTSALIPVIALLLAIAIFVVDWIVPAGFAIAVLYVAVVLLAVDVCDRRGVLLVSSGCMALTVLAYGLEHGLAGPDESMIRAAVSLAAIALTTVLALRNQAANAALRAQAELLDLTHDTVFVRDVESVITYWNRGAEETYGWPRALAVGKVSHELMRTEFPEPLAEIDATLRRTGRWEGELVHTRRDGRRIIVASRWSMRRDERGQPLATLETNNDITESRRTREALQQSQLALAHVNRVTSLGELTASIAHEVNQPVAAAVTNASAGLRWLAAQPPDLDEARQAFARIVKDANRAGEVIRRIRALVKKAPPRQDPVDINEALREVIALARSEIQRHGVVFEAQLAADLPRIPGDRIQLQQVALNLILNAVEAMSGAAGPRRLIVRSAPHDGGIVVAVRDSGPGLSLEGFDHLFDAFYTTKPDGIGMGLAISRSIVEAHGGRLWASRGEPSGAVFEFSLPIADEALAHDARGSS
jgi:PAS domain S-box-containing protein